VCTEETNRRGCDEFKMRVRVIAQTLTDLWRHRAMMNPLRSGFYAVELFSHKVMRYAVPLFLFAILVSTTVLALNSRMYLALVGLQLGFYLSAVAGWGCERMGVSHCLLSLPHYFMLANLASVIAFHKFLNGQRYASWEPIRECPQPSAAKS